MTNYSYASSVLRFCRAVTYGNAIWLSRHKALPYGLERWHEIRKEKKKKKKKKKRKKKKKTHTHEEE